MQWSREAFLNWTEPQVHPLAWDIHSIETYFSSASSLPCGPASASASVSETTPATTDAKTAGSKRKRDDEIQDFQTKRRREEEEKTKKRKKKGKANETTAPDWSKWMVHGTEDVLIDQQSGLHMAHVKIQRGNKMSLRVFFALDVYKIARPTAVKHRRSISAWMQSAGLVTDDLRVQVKMRLPAASCNNGVVPNKIQLCNVLTLKGLECALAHSMQSCRADDLSLNALKRLIAHASCLK